MAEFWLKCTECKSEIAYGAKYYQCSVSTCNRSKLRLVFCSIVCWDSHLADARHRDAWAEEARAPTREAWQRESAAAAAAASSTSAAPPRPVTPPNPAPAPAPVRPAATASPQAPSATPAPAPAPASAPARRVV